MAINDHEVDILIGALEDPTDGLVERRGALLRDRQEG